MATGTIKKENTVTATFDYVTAKRNGNVVELQVNFPGSYTSFTANAWNTAGVINSTFRPSSAIDFIIINNKNSGASTIPLQLRVNPSGTVAVWVYSSTNVQPIGTVTYLV